VFGVAVLIQILKILKMLALALQEMHMMNEKSFFYFLLTKKNFFIRFTYILLLQKNFFNKINLSQFITLLMHFSEFV